MSSNIFDVLIFLASLGLLAGGVAAFSSAVACIVIGSLGICLTLYVRTRKVKPDEPS